MQSMKGESWWRENKSEEKESILWGDAIRAQVWMGRENGQDCLQRVAWNYFQQGMEDIREPLPSLNSLNYTF